MIGIRNFGPGNNAEIERRFNEAKRGHQAGDPRATRALASFYITGNGAARSFSKAIELLESIADFDGAKEPYSQKRPDKVDGAPHFIEALRADFLPLQSLPLPISGGWGYEKADAIIIDPAIDDPHYNPGDSFDFDGLKNLLITHRIYEECCVRQFEPLEGLTWEIDEHEEFEENGRHFEHLTFIVSGYPVWVWNALKEDWISASRHLNNTRAGEHSFIRQWFVKTYKTEYWFDISSSIEDTSQQN